MEGKREEEKGGRERDRVRRGSEERECVRMIDTKREKEKKT